MDYYVNNKKFSDIILVTDDNERIHGHKIILSRIPFFDNLFNSEMRESYQSEIRLEFISSKILLKIIKYIYTTTISIEFEDSITLYEACSYLGLEDLKQLCEEKILLYSNNENACDILLKADEFNSILMKERIMKFIIENFNDITSTQGFSNLMNHKDLALELIRSYSSHMKTHRQYVPGSNSLIN